MNIIDYIEKRKLLLGIGIANFEDTIEIAEKCEIKDLKLKALIGRQRINELDLILDELQNEINSAKRKWMSKFDKTKFMLKCMKCEGFIEEKWK